MQLPDLPIASNSVLGVGTDLIYVPRIEVLYDRYGQRFLNKILTLNEQAYCLASLRNSERVARIASRIGLKEATAKVLLTGLTGLGKSDGPTWKDIEVNRTPQGAPLLTLYGKAFACAQSLGITTFQSSASHDGEYAFAIVIGLAH